MNDRRSLAPTLLSALCALLISAACIGTDANELLPNGDGRRDSTAERAARFPSNLPPIRNLSYFTIAPDPRLCPSPLCGGYWVSRVNHASTACADGTLAPTCYVSELDLSRSGLSDEQESAVRGAAGHLLMLGSIRAKAFMQFGVVGVFQGREAWLGH